MQVVLKSGGTDYTLAHGPEHIDDNHIGPSDDIRQSIRTNLQVDTILRAAAVSIKNRNNTAGRLSFSVTCRKATMAAATSYAFNYPYVLPRTGVIWITEGANIVKLTAGIEDVSTVQIGVTVIITYSIVFGSAEFV